VTCAVEPFNCLVIQAGVSSQGHKISISVGGVTQPREPPEVN
jgi:hypothetical protein